MDGRHLQAALRVRTTHAVLREGTKARGMIAFIGSGPHNLAALAFLLKAAPSLRSEVRVFDPSGTWLSRWNRQMEGQEIVHLRSSSVHHPDPDPLALRRFAAGRYSEFYPPYSLPGTALFRE